MKLASKAETQQNLDEFNQAKRAVDRDRPYVPLVIPDDMDTCSPHWLEYCLALQIHNLPSKLERTNRIERLSEKNPGLMKRVMPHLERIQRDNE